jgi:hypothetical protein
MVDWEPEEEPFYETNTPIHHSAIALLSVTKSIAKGDNRTKKSGSGDA